MMIFLGIDLIILYLSKKKCIYINDMTFFPVFFFYLFLNPQLSRNRICNLLQFNEKKIDLFNLFNCKCNKT